MKKLAILLFSGFSFLQSGAQVTTDTVSIGASYPKQVWYSMANDEQGSALQSNWDLCFDVSQMGFGIGINSASGMMVWKYPKADTTGWNSMDTTGLSTWNPHWNSTQHWELGAIGNYYNPNVPGDVDWGVYDFASHSVKGDSLYIIKLQNGDFKKLWIKSITGSLYIFQYAELNGSNEHLDSLNKNDFSGKNLGYYSIQTNKQMDREPISTDWDIVFTTYTALLPVPHTEAAVLSNENVDIARCTQIPDVNTYKDYVSATYTDSVSGIGHDWKTGSGSNYTIKDSLLYFVQTATSDIWKIVFKGFGGIANGDYIFSKEQLNTTTGITEAGEAPKAVMTIYPNPCIDGNCHILYNMGNTKANTTINVYDITGKRIYSDNISSEPGLQQYTLSLSAMTKGNYIVNISNQLGTRLQQNLVIQ